MYIAIKVPNRTAEIVSQAIIKALKDFPEDMVKTITFDRGKEFGSTYFCDPYCAWQKGTNENANGLLREFYPKGMDLSLDDEDELKHNLELMNNRPRKCLGYKTPNEVMNETDSHTSCCT
jgi:IS30 family transposase